MYNQNVDIISTSAKHISVCLDLGETLLYWYTEDHVIPSSSISIEYLSVKQMHPHIKCQESNSDGSHSICYPPTLQKVLASDMLAVNALALP